MKGFGRFEEEKSKLTRRILWKVYPFENYSTESWCIKLVKGERFRFKMRGRNSVLPIQFSWHYWGSLRGTLGFQSTSFKNTDTRENVPGKAYRIPSEKSSSRKAAGLWNSEHLGSADRKQDEYPYLGPGRPQSGEESHSEGTGKRTEANSIYFIIL